MDVLKPRFFYVLRVFLVLILVFPIVRFAEAAVPGDPLLSNQYWYLNLVHAPEAWDKTTGSADVIVAVLDSGVDLDHPDLVTNLWLNGDEIENNGIDDDKNGYVDDVRGWDFLDDDAVPMPDRNQPYLEGAVAHGTVVSGVIGAVGGNAEGIVGLNWRVKIMPLRILDNFGSGVTTDVADAIRYAINNGADAINLSFTGTENDLALKQMMHEAYQAGIPIVAAVGNRPGAGFDLDESPRYPACYKDDDGSDLIIGVASINDTATKSKFSNYGTNCTDLAAPGENIYGLDYEDSSWPGFDTRYTGGWSGTSVAAPMVTGAAALLKSVYPSLGAKDIRNILMLAADAQLLPPGLQPGDLGAGRLNIARALEIAPSFVPTTVYSVVAAPTTSSSQSVFVSVSGTGMIRRFSSRGEFLNAFEPYPKFKGAIRVAVGDVDGEGVDEVITAPGPGGGPQVRVFEVDGTPRSQFFAFSEKSRTGLFVSTGDVDGDGVEDLLVSQDAGGEGWVKAFNPDGKELIALRPFDYTRRSIRVAAGDLDGDGLADIVSGMGGSGTQRVRVYRSDGEFLSEFDAYAKAQGVGVFVAVGDVDGNGTREIVIAPDRGAAPTVKIFDLKGNLLKSFLAYGSGFRGGVRIETGDVNRDRVDEIYAIPGPSGGPHVRVFNHLGSPVGGFFGYDETDRSGGFLAAW